MAMWSMRIAFWILSATDTLPECVILIALTLQPYFTFM
jgi:hypothetical protein